MIAEPMMSKILTKLSSQKKKTKNEAEEVNNRRKKKETVQFTIFFCSFLSYMPMDGTLVVFKVWIFTLFSLNATSNKTVFLERRRGKDKARERICFKIRNDDMI